MSNPLLEVEITELIAKAQQGDANAQCVLGWRYLVGQNVSQDYKEAISWYIKAANQEYAIAQFGLGWMYNNGLGVPPDPQSAIFWYSKAAEQGYSFAQYNLGLIYMNGEGVDESLNKAKELFNKAAQDPEVKFKAIECQDKIERKILSPEITTIRGKILEKLKVDTDKQSTMTHYTSLVVGHALLLENSPLRLGHINAVNDPNEGKLLWHALGHAPVEAKPVFIGCFLPDNDSLNMWRFYSKNHNNEDACGCAITFNVADFFDYRLLAQEPELLSEGNTEPTYSNTGKYPQESASFYRVVYIADDGRPLNDEADALKNDFDLLKKAANDFLGEKPTDEKYSQLAKLLGPLPYLLKDADYKDEQEHRLIVTHLDYGSQEIQCVKPDVDAGIPPKLYLELHRDNHLKPIKHVTLGPKAPHKEMMAPYWHHQLARSFGKQLEDKRDFYIKPSKCSYK